VLRTDAEVIVASLESPEDFGVIFDRHCVAIHAYLARRVARESDALLGDVFRVAFERRGSYQLDRPDALPWLYGIAWNVIARERRGVSRHGRALVRAAGMRDTTAHDIEQSNARLDAVADRTALAAAIGSLPDSEREALLLLAWEELSYEAIAEAQGVPVGTVRSRLSRARRRVRELLPRHGEEPVMRAREQRGEAF
jgi:RNA polymerase sigma-70 factor (ECF subfamily)